MPIHTNSKGTGKAARKTGTGLFSHTHMVLMPPHTESGTTGLTPHSLTSHRATLTWPCSHASRMGDHLSCIPAPTHTHTKAHTGTGISTCTRPHARGHAQPTSTPQKRSITHPRPQTPTGPHLGHGFRVGASDVDQPFRSGKVSPSAGVHKGRPPRLCSQCSHT